MSGVEVSKLCAFDDTTVFWLRLFKRLSDIQMNSSDFYFFFFLILDSLKINLTNVKRIEISFSYGQKIGKTNEK